MESNMVRLYVDLCIEQKYNEPDFEIKMDENLVNQIAQVYAHGIEASGMSDDDFGPIFYGQLRTSNPDLAQAIEDAVYDALVEGISGEFDLELQSELQDIGIAAPTQDEKGNWFVAIVDGLNIEYNLSDWPRFL